MMLSAEFNAVVLAAAIAVLRSKDVHTVGQAAQVEFAAPGSIEHNSAQQVEQ